MKVLFLATLLVSIAFGSFSKVIIEIENEGQEALPVRHVRSKPTLNLAQLTQRAIASELEKLNEGESEHSIQSLDLKDDISLQVPLESRGDAVYVGTIYLGAPQSQPARVVFDTGSEYLAVTSALCDDAKAGNYKFKVYDPANNDFIKKDVPNRCSTLSYNMHQSNTGKILSRSSSKLAYGSANLQGFIWEDNACLQQLGGNATAQQMKEDKCAPFEFLALYKADGLEDNTDGILGLSPHKNEEKRKLHYLWALKDNGIISRAMVSFSIASNDMLDGSYALFGGVNSTQILGGTEGLKSFPSFKNFLGTWALEGQKVFYDGNPMEGTEQSYPAIIDTGTSQMSIPPRVFAHLQEAWHGQVPGGIDCKTDETFCTSDKPCAEIAKAIKTVGLQMSDYVFELKPSQYLYQADGGKCYFTLNECKLGGKNKDIYIMGAAFLKHYYSAFDFDKNEISLGVNLHSEGLVTMKPAPKA